MSIPGGEENVVNIGPVYGARHMAQNGVLKLDERLLSDLLKFETVSFSYD